MKAGISVGMQRLGAFAAGGLILVARLADAQLLSVDINGTVRADVTAPGFTPWYMAVDLAGHRQSALHSFTNYVIAHDPITGLPTATNISSIIGCKATMTVPAVADATHYLNANYANKNGNSTSPDPNAGCRLCGDGCWSHWKDDALGVDQPNTNGGAISLTISNLPAGVHSITTYHNDLWSPSTPWHGAHTMSRCVISGEAEFCFLLQYSDDLRNRTTWTNLTATAQVQPFVAPGFPSQRSRFYRVISVQ